MILVDTSVWIDHLRHGNESLSRLLDDGGVLTHPFLIGELALGNLRQRERVLRALYDLPCSIVATHDEVMHLIERRSLFGRGIGYVDAHLLAAITLTAGAHLWTYDKRLHNIAAELALALTLR